MASSNNRFALLDAKSDTQPVHGVEDTIEFPVIAGPETKHKKKKKKAKQPRQISSDDQGEISSTEANNLHGNGWVLQSVTTADIHSPAASELALSANYSNSSQTPIPSPFSPESLLREPSDVPPPAYTLPKGTTGVRVTADGSPRVAGSEYVKVGADLRWPDKSTTHTVRRGTSQDNLKGSTPVKDLLDFGQADVKVSPPASAKSGTKIHVDSSYEALRIRMKEDIEEALEIKAKKLLAEFQEDLKSRTKYYREFAVYMWMRHLQDSVFYAMSSAMGKEDFKGWGGFDQLVDTYTRKFVIEILLPSDIEHLKSATDRDKANAYAHPKIRDLKAQELRWRSLDSLLKEDPEMDEERARYKRYFEFVKMKLF